MVVGYYSDSLGLSRLGHVSLDERYIYLFEKWLRQNYSEEIFLINRARPAFTIDKLYRVYREDLEYVAEKKDILIIHEGICDCAPRPVPTRLRRIISVLPGFLKSRVISFLHAKRPWLLKNGFSFHLTGVYDYERILKEWMKSAVNEFERIYIVNIAPTNIEMDQHSPGFQNSIARYNLIIKKVINELNNSKIRLIDIHDTLLKVENLDEFVIKEDGHHLTSLAHRLIADRLVQMEKAFLEHA
ncbi:MAG TPA: hypothetical protein VGD17_19440 [Chitinophagaceae bacterium]